MSLLGKAITDRQGEKMVGNKSGAKLAAMVNLANDPDFYSRIGKLGGSHKGNKGFGSQRVGKDGLTGPERAHKVGFKGGMKRLGYRKDSPRKKINIFLRLKRWLNTTMRQLSK
jgi:general stress protein YciG